MKIMRIWTSLLLALTMGLTLAACGGQNLDSEGQKTTAPTESTASQSEPAASSDASDAPEQSQESQREEPTEEGEKILVAYFSATGNTEAVAQIIASQLEADLFEIVPAQPYADADLNYSDDTCRANQEQNNPAARPEIAAVVDNIEDYDVVLLGFPIWWGQEPRILDTFVESYDWSGKTVAAFCTSGGSGIGTAEANLQELCGAQANWAGSQRFSQGADESAIAQWLSGAWLAVIISSYDVKVCFLF